MTSNPLEQWEEALIEECVRISSTPEFLSSYSAPREAFRDVIKKSLTTDREETLRVLEHWQKLGQAFGDACSAVASELKERWKHAQQT